MSTSVTSMNTAGSVASPSKASRMSLTLPMQHVPRRLVMGAKERQHEADDQDGVEERQREHEWWRQTAIGGAHRNAESAHDQDQKDLRREPGTDEDFDQRADTLDRKHPPALGNERGLRDRLQHRLNCNKLKVKR